MGYTDMTSAWAYKQLVTWQNVDAHAENQADMKDFLTDESFQVHQVVGGSPQSISNNTWTKLVMNTVDWDPKSGWSVSNNRFTPARAGKWLFMGSHSVFFTGDNMALRCALYKNGAIHRRGTNGLNNIGGTVRSPWSTLACIADVTLGDYFELWGYYARGLDEQGAGFCGSQLVGFDNATTLKPYFSATRLF